ncbi:MAG: hypothetical protein PHE83_18465 [Opitutaceae bacterium]|nr:hypothetical protein [Opitutaceae bacterium]
MPRLTHLPALLALVLAAAVAPVPAGGAPGPLENDLTDLLARLEKNSINPFAAPVGTSDNGLQGVYEVLSAITSPLFGPDGTGTVMFENHPWRVGETATVTVGGGKSPVHFRSLTPPGGDNPGSALFELGDTHQQISIDLPTLGSAGTTLTNPAAHTGWLLGGRTIITPAVMHGGPVIVHCHGTEYPARAVSQAPEAGLTLVLLDRPLAMSFPAAGPDDEARVRIVTLDGRAFRVSPDLLRVPPTPALVGSLVLTDDNRLVGILGARGLIDIRRLHLPAGDQPDSHPEARRLPPLVFMTPAPGLTAGPP